MQDVPYSLNIGGQLIELTDPIVMGILNATPDSFYSASRVESEKDIAQRAQQIVSEGGDIIDIGAYSTRPGADEVSQEEEMNRLRLALGIITKVAPEAIVSVDTFRADVAKMCVEECGAHIINDISGGTMDRRMFRTVTHLGVPYVLTHIQGTPQTMQQQCQYEDLLVDIMQYFSQRVNDLRALGAKDIILDPGFGFGKNLEQNYALMHHLDDFSEFDLPLLVGVSRKSMIHQLLGVTPAESLTGTIALQTVALTKGANIIRAHDVREAVESIRIVQAVAGQTQPKLSH
ncbi:MAG: dihydropteroate synthase [Bacteroidaceae bacterium]|nr:dihydropteroate synthase [Bacteroidaceae bacterium]